MHAHHPSQAVTVTAERLNALIDDVANLVAVVEEARGQHDELRARVEALQLDVADLVQQSATSGRGGAPANPVFEDWQSWVTKWLVPRISRGPNFRWCNEFAEHPEVADRLEALWHLWEAMWPKPLERASWFRDGLDHHLAVIAAPDGPLRRCSAAELHHTAAPFMAQGP